MQAVLDHREDERLREPDDHVSAALRSPVSLGEHGVRLPDTGSGTQVNAQLPARRHAALAVSGHTFNSAPSPQVKLANLTTSMRLSR